MLDMSFTESLTRFTQLTIGDGLVTQTPSLMISTASGLMVSRAASKNNLGEDIATQLFQNKKAAIVSAVLGKGGNSYDAYNSLSSQLENYGLNVFKDFYLFSSENNLDKKLKESTQHLEFNAFLDEYLRS